MSWQGDDDGTSDPLPVDTLVKSLRDILNDVQDICTDYRGQEKHCCNSVRGCYDNVSPTLIEVRLQAALKQDMHRACRRLDDHFHVVNNCVDNRLRMCNKTDTTSLINDFEETKQRFKTEFDRHCSNLPPEITAPPTPTPTTTTTTTTTEVTTTTTLPHTTTTAPQATSQMTEMPQRETTLTKSSTKKVFDSTSVRTTTHVDKPTSISRTTDETNTVITDTGVPTAASSTRSAIHETTQFSKVTPTSPKHTTSTNRHLSKTSDIIHTTTSIQISSTGDDGNNSLPSGSDVTLEHPSSDNTVIIVSAVCSAIVLLLVLIVFAVIRIRQKKLTSGSNICLCPQCLLWKGFQRNKAETNQADTEIYAEIDEAFMKAVYEFDMKKDPHPNLKNRVQGNAHANAVYIAGMDDNIIGSKKAHGPTLQLSTRNLRQVPRQNEYETTENLKAQLQKKPKQGFVMSHPTFTDPRGTEVISDEYVQISEKYEDIHSVYDQPNSEDQNISSVMNESDRNEYDHILAKEAELYEDYEPSYVNAHAHQNNDHLYENEIGDYEITQSRF